MLYHEGELIYIKVKFLGLDYECSKVVRDNIKNKLSLTVKNEEGYEDTIEYAGISDKAWAGFSCDGNYEVINPAPSNDELQDKINKLEEYITRLESVLVNSNTINAKDLES